MSATTEQGTVIVLVGPTGVGKTGAAVELARRLGTEIISADSMQIYRHMDIGTEKPTPEQLGAARHHMIDVADPSERFSVGRYLDEVVPAIEALLAAGKVPIVAGGTGLYIKAMTRGLFDGPEADEDLRAEFRQEETPELYARLQQTDAEAARSIEPTDKRRIVRALEVCIISGGRFSELRDSLTRPLPFRFVKLALTRDRKELYRMIEQRVDEMLERGLVEEVKRLLEMNPSETPMQAIGYKEMAAHLRGEYPLEEAVRLIKRNTKRYAKRQFTWFRKEPGLHWVDITGIREPGPVLEKILPILRQEGIEI